MKVKALVLGSMRTNCYIGSHPETKAAFIVDPGADAAAIQSYIAEEGLLPEMILLTHGHYDHIGAVNELRAAYDIPCLCARTEAPLVGDPALNLSSSFGRKHVTAIPDEVLDEGERTVIGYGMQIIATPGHTGGGMCFYFPTEKLIFTGDTLFRGTIGRTDLPTGDYEALLKSLNVKLMRLDDDVIVYPGHGFRSTIAIEREQNPYVEK